VTSYGPAATMITNKGRGMYMQNNNIGIADFTIKTRGQFLYWHTDSVTGTILSGEDPLELSQIVSTTIGTMKPLPKWIQQGCIVGMVNG